MSTPWIKTDAVTQLLRGDTFLFPFLPFRSAGSHPHTSRRARSEGSSLGRRVKSRKDSRSGVKHATVTKKVTFCSAACSGIAFQSKVDGFRLLDWRPVVYCESQRPLGEKRATVQRRSKGGPIISGRLCVAKWLQQLAACMSAGRKPLPESLPQTLSSHP